MVKLSEIELPLVLKNKLLFAYGQWNHWDIQPSEVDKAYSLTDWERKRIKAIYMEHRDTDAERWVGNINNPQSVNGELYGDLEIWDVDTALKLSSGQAPFAVSAKIGWDAESKEPTDFSYENFSLVAEPGIRREDIFINFSKDGGRNEAKFYLDLMSNERGTNSKKMEKKEDNSATFSLEDFNSLVARVSKLESQIATFSTEPETKEEEPKEEPVEETQEVQTEEPKPEEEVKEEVKETEEVVEEKSEEPVEEVAETEEVKEEPKEETQEAKFSADDAVLNELKAIRETLGKSIVPSNSATFTKKKPGFDAAFDRLEKEFA